MKIKEDIPANSSLNSGARTETTTRSTRPSTFQPKTFPSCGRPRTFKRSRSARNYWSPSRTSSSQSKSTTPSKLVRAVPGNPRATGPEEQQTPPGAQARQVGQGPNREIRGGVQVLPLELGGTLARVHILRESGLVRCRNKFGRNGLRGTELFRFDRVAVALPPQKFHAILEPAQRNSSFAESRVPERRVSLLFSGELRLSFPDTRPQVRLFADFGSGFFGK